MLSIFSLNSRSGGCISREVYRISFKWAERVAERGHFRNLTKYNISFEIRIGKAIRI